jgi:DNA-binding CsgD family transcriptional regulator
VIEELLGEALEPTVTEQARYRLAQALIELARYDEARRVVDDLLAAAPRDSQSYGTALLAAADLGFFSGRLREAVAAADECLAHYEGLSTIVQLTRSWAAFELGLELGEPMPRPFHPLVEAASFEEAGVRALAAGSPAEAADLLARAAVLWRGRNSRGELRSMWGAGEALRRAGERDAAVQQLVAVEREATARGALAHLSRIRRSLRLMGVRRSRARSPGERGLTGREREVLELVGAGLSNMEIARRLGIGRPTVVGLIRSASRKLGARTRTQAAVLAARE